VCGPRGETAFEKVRERLKVGEEEVVEGEQEPFLAVVEEGAWTDGRESIEPHPAARSSATTDRMPRDGKGSSRCVEEVERVKNAVLVRGWRRKGGRRRLHGEEKRNINVPLGLTCPPTAGADNNKIRTIDGIFINRGNERNVVIGGE
jgi:hypothetical protein